MFKMIRVTIIVMDILVCYEYCKRDIPNAEIELV